MSGIARRLAPSVLLALAGILALAACDAPWQSLSRDHHDSMHGGRDTRDDEPVAASGDGEVVIADYAFVPGNLEITAGTTVEWTNRDGVGHTATAEDSSWTTGVLRQDESFTITFDVPGVYDYFCEPHPNMRARLEVVP